MELYKMARYTRIFIRSFAPFSSLNDEEIYGIGAGDSEEHHVVKAHKIIVKIEDYDDLYECGLASCQLRGEMSVSTERFTTCECCSNAEQQMLDKMRNALRPRTVSKDFISQCFCHLDESDSEEEDIDKEN